MGNFIWGETSTQISNDSADGSDPIDVPLPVQIVVISEVTKKDDV